MTLRDAVALEAVLTAVRFERQEQNAKWGVQRHDPAVWLAILTEEVGEVAKEVADGNAGPLTFRGPEYREELVQVAAVAVAAIESYDAREGA